MCIRDRYKLKDQRKVDKHSELVMKVKDWVDAEYDTGRVTVITDNELVVVITNACKELGIVL